SQKEGTYPYSRTVFGAENCQRLSNVQDSLTSGVGALPVMILAGDPLAILHIVGAGAGLPAIPLIEVGAGLTHLIIAGVDHTLLTTVAAGPIHLAMIGGVITITVRGPTLVLALVGHQYTGRTGPVLDIATGIIRQMSGTINGPEAGTAQCLAATRLGGGTTPAATRQGRGGATLLVSLQGLGEAQGGVILAAPLQVQGGAQKGVVAQRVAVGVSLRAAVQGLLLGWFRDLSLLARLLLLLEHLGVSIKVR
ncbi:hypothetical protein CRG98_013128, partial [Punica granatum]